MKIEIEINIIHLLVWGSNPQPGGFTVTLCAPAPRVANVNELLYNWLIAFPINES